VEHCFGRSDRREKRLDCAGGGPGGVQDGDLESPCGESKKRVSRRLFQFESFACVCADAGISSYHR
jgi:hypothetical protein